MSWAPFLAPERQRDYGIPYGGTRYYVAPGWSISTSAGTQTLSINTDHYCFYWVESRCVVDQFAFECTTGQASSNVRFALYRADTSLQPVGPPLADSGLIATTGSGVKTYTPGSPLFVPRGRYTIAMNADLANIGVRLYKGGTPRGGPETAHASGLGSTSQFQTFNVGRTFAAFPTPGTEWTTGGTASGNGNGFIVLWRVIGL